MVNSKSQAWLVLWLLLAGVLAPDVALAQSAAEVAPGGSIVLDRTTDQAMTIVELKPAAGALAVATQLTASTLVYAAPEKAVDGQQAAVTYKVGGDPRSVVVTIRDPAPTLTDPRLYQASFRALFTLFILAVLVESGLALLFNWRPFVETFDGRKTNALIAFVFSYAFVQAFNLDITTTLVNVYSNTSYPPGIAGLVLTALVIAGGSAGVRRIMQTFGFRPPGAADEPPPTPNENEAWIAVTLLRQKAVGPVDVQIGAPGQVAVAGTIAGTSRMGGLFHYFLRSRGRFPGSGGYRVTPGQFELRLSGVDGQGAALEASWGPAQIGKRAIVDVQLKL